MLCGDLQSPSPRTALRQVPPTPHSSPRASPGGSRACLPLQPFTRPRPSRFPAELGCSLNFQCWFDFLQWYHMLLCKQSTWSGQTKEHVCCKPSPYHGSASSARRGPGRRALIFPCGCRGPGFPEAAGRGRGGGGWGWGGEGAREGGRPAPRGAPQPSRRRAPAPLQLLRLRFTSDGLLGDWLFTDHSPGMPAGGGGRALYTAVKTSRTRGAGTSARARLRLGGTRGAPPTYQCNGER